MSKRLLALLAAFLFAGTGVACTDNAEDNLNEAAEEQAEGDFEEAQEEMQEAERNLAEGDTTEGLN